MPEREDGDLTEFVDLPLFGSMPTAIQSGNGARPEPPSADGEAAETRQPPAVTPAGREGGEVEEALSGGEQLRLL